MPGISGECPECERDAYLEDCSFCADSFCVDCLKTMQAANEWGFQCMYQKYSAVSPKDFSSYFHRMVRNSALICDDCVQQSHSFHCDLCSAPAPLVENLQYSQRCLNCELRLCNDCSVRFEEYPALIDAFKNIPGENSVICEQCLHGAQLEHRGSAEEDEEDDVSLPDDSHSEANDS